LKVEWFAGKPFGYARMKERPKPMTSSKVIPFVHKKRILLIEDDDLVRNGLTLALVNKGFTVHAMPTAEEAIKAVNRIFYHGIICDYHLPGMNGLDFFLHAKAQTLRSTNILITAFGFDQIANSCAALGIDAFYEKPFPIQSLLTTLSIKHKTVSRALFHRQGEGQ
jgi:CheY-like chemotaxis protein